jgi:hypothetical protein
MNNNKFKITKVSKEEHNKIMNDPTIIKISKKDMDLETLNRIVNDLSFSGWVATDKSVKIEIVDDCPKCNNLYLIKYDE